MFLKYNTSMNITSQHSKNNSFFLSNPANNENKSLRRFTMKHIPMKLLPKRCYFYPLILIENFVSKKVLTWEESRFSNDSVLNFSDQHHWLRWNEIRHLLEMEKTQHELLYAKLDLNLRHYNMYQSQISTTKFELQRRFTDHML